MILIMLLMEAFLQQKQINKKKYRLYLESKFKEHLEQLNYVNSATVDITDAR